MKLLLLTIFTLFIVPLPTTATAITVPCFSADQKSCYSNYNTETSMTRIQAICVSVAKSITDRPVHKHSYYYAICEDKFVGHIIAAVLLGVGLIGYFVIRALKLIKARHSKK